MLTEFPKHSSFSLKLSQITVNSVIFCVFCVRFTLFRLFPQLHPWFRDHRNDSTQLLSISAEFILFIINFWNHLQSSTAVFNSWQQMFWSWCIFVDVAKKSTAAGLNSCWLVTKCDLIMFSFLYHVTLGASRTTSAVQTGGLACRCLRPALRESTVLRWLTSLQTRLCLETFSTDTITTPRRALLDRSSGPRSGNQMSC